MVRAYPLYFDCERVDGERRARRLAALSIVALHVALLFGLLVSPPIRRALDDASRLVVVELVDVPRPRVVAGAPVRAVTPPKAPSAAVPGPLARPPAVAPDSAAARRPAVTESVEATGNAAATGVSPPAGADALASSGAAAGAAARSHFHPPRTLRSWLPPYPEDAFRGGHQGVVDLLVTIAADGTLIAAHVARSSGNDSLDRAALESLDRYKFKAADRDGVPVRADAYVTINWIITPDVVQRVTAPRIERIDPLNLTNQRKQTQYGSYLKSLQRERENDPDGR